MESAMVDLEVQASKNIERCSFSFAKIGINEYCIAQCRNISFNHFMIFQWMDCGEGLYRHLFVYFTRENAIMKTGRTCYERNQN